MTKFRLHDWNDVNLLLLCAELGSFGRAAERLGIQQVTVSRRIAYLEAAAGRPLFTRKRSGATLTPAGLELLAVAREFRGVEQRFEEKLSTLAALPAPQVTVAASDGLVAYTLAPLFEGDKAHYLALDRGDMREEPPPVTFTTNPVGADIAILATSPGDVPVVPSTHKVRRIGSMRFSPVAGRLFARRKLGLGHFDDLRRVPLIHNRIYRMLRGLDDWNATVAGREPEAVAMVDSTPGMHAPLLTGFGVGILPAYSTLYDKQLVLVDVPTPQLIVPLWLTAHGDRLREPAVRWMFDALGTMFLRSPWFR